MTPVSSALIVARSGQCAGVAVVRVRGAGGGDGLPIRLKLLGTRSCLYTAERAQEGGHDQCLGLNGKKC